MFNHSIPLGNAVFKYEASNHLISLDGYIDIMNHRRQRRCELSFRCLSKIILGEKTATNCFVAFYSDLLLVKEQQKLDGTLYQNKRYRVNTF